MSLPEINLSSELLTRHNKKNRKKPKLIWKLLGYAFLTAVLLAIIFLIWFFFTPSGTQKRDVIADTIISTQHRAWAKYLIGSGELQERVDAYSQRFDEYAEKPITEKAIIPEIIPIQKDLVEIEPISGTGFKGYLLTISDPKKVRLAVTESTKKGEKVSTMVQRTGAIAGVNGGGFIDPNWEGNGFQPEGIVISGGKILYKDVGMNTSLHVMGIDQSGQMIAGKYSPTELLNMHVMEAASFAPRFIVNGVGQIKGQSDGWGIAPRTCMAQKRDGSIMFIVIDGRQPGYSIGASLYDVQQVLLEHDAVIAANLDGGASSVLVKDNEIINRPSSKWGERFLPTAWLVFDNPDSVYIRNPWEGLDPNKIDASTW
ncbi:phosphodiester glycosidase family protein [Paenibacillus psychroresistens]|uniref:Phosphodiester glycosidase family protein n=1 Tax=Paenibacillus psychroresistens TaxID=1778678 RepID=A0A6B8RM56_9BACL|nr:phosphodiester glycosidase family protein [Paenibacillus psychroresistens]QGQ97481.1 phosphodiester glycosidase family protein [Paenibacillus psychroresistens]